MNLSAVAALVLFAASAVLTEGRILSQAPSSSANLTNELVETTTSTYGNTSAGSHDQLAANATLNQAAISNSTTSAATAEVSGQTCIYNVQEANTGAQNSSGTLALSTDGWPSFGPGFPTLQYLIESQTPNRVHVKIQPANNISRYEVPEDYLPRPTADAVLENPLYVVQQQSIGSPFHITVQRKSNNKTVFETTGHSFCFKEQYIELTTTLPADASLYGLGELSLPTGLLLPRDGSIITLWNRDIGSFNPYANLYGSHPFYLQVNADGSSHGVFLLNSNGMDVILNETSLTYKVVGGIVDLYIFMGPTPEDVIRQYHDVIGHPAMPTFWSLGLHQSRWGYANASVLQEVVANYSAANLPLEVIWSDIDYMAGRFWNFEFHPQRYPVSEMNAFVKQLSANGQHWVPIIDAGTPAAPVANQEAISLVEGRLYDVFVRDYQDNYYMGQVWPGMTHYPDFVTHPNATLWWTKQMRRMFDQVPASGIWIDMNEVQNFCTGMVCVPPNQTQYPAAYYALTVAAPMPYNMTDFIMPMVTCQMNCTIAGPENKLANPPYLIHNYLNNETRNASMDHSTLATNARHYGGFLEYDVHNLYGASMAKATYRALVETTGTRPFILTRSSWPGTGRYSAHWTGDNAATWNDLYWSIAGILNSNFWGIPHVGADICGFNDDHVISDTEYQQLCNRWASAGAFYPFARNHMNYNGGGRPHEFYLWPDVTKAAATALQLRYRMLSYLYSAFYLAHENGGTVAKPLFFTDPTDINARNATKQWMLGDAVLISPVILPNVTSADAYFTRGRWYSAWDYTALDSKGEAVTLTLPLGEVGVHYRGGAIIGLRHYAITTAAVANTPITLIIALPSNTANTTTSNTTLGVQGSTAPYYLEADCAKARASTGASQVVACGLLYADEGTNLNITTDNSLLVRFIAAADSATGSGSLNSTVISAGGPGRNTTVEALDILGVKPPSATSTNATAASAMASPAGGTAANETGAAANEQATTANTTASSGGTSTARRHLLQAPASAAAGGASGNAVPRVTVNGVAVNNVTYDAGKGVVRVAGFSGSVNEPLNIAWQF